MQRDDTLERPDAEGALHIKKLEAEKLELEAKKLSAEYDKLVAETKRLSAHWTKDIEFFKPASLAAATIIASAIASISVFAVQQKTIERITIERKEAESESTRKIASLENKILELELENKKLATDKSDAVNLALLSISNFNSMVNSANFEKTAKFEADINRKAETIIRSLIRPLK